MEDAKEFRTLFFEAIDRIRSLGIDFHGLSFYLPTAMCAGGTSSHVQAA